MVVAGAQVDVAAQAVFLAAHQHQHLGVGLVAEHAVHDVGADFFELGRPADVGLLVEAGHQLQHHGHLGALLRRADQVLHQHRIGAGAIDRHLDGDDAGVVGGGADQFDHRAETLERVMQQDVLAPQYVEQRHLALDH